MKTRTLILLASVAFLLTTPRRAAEAFDDHLTRQIAEVLSECSKVAPGATRAQLLKVFTTEGGISNAKHHRYVYRRCPYIKVDVDFKLLDPKQNIVDEKPGDVIAKISKPYLQWRILD